MPDVTAWSMEGVTKTAKRFLFQRAPQARQKIGRHDRFFRPQRLFSMRFWRNRHHFCQKNPAFGGIFRYPVSIFPYPVRPHFELEDPPPPTPPPTRRFRLYP